MPVPQDADPEPDPDPDPTFDPWPLGATVDSALDAGVQRRAECEVAREVREDVEDVRRADAATRSLVDRLACCSAPMRLLLDDGTTLIGTVAAILDGAVVLDPGHRAPAVIVSEFCIIGVDGAVTDDGLVTQGRTRRRSLGSQLRTHLGEGGALRMHLRACARVVESDAAVAAVAAADHIDLGDGRLITYAAVRQWVLLP